MPSLTVAFIYTCAVLRANGCNNLTLTPADLVEEFDEKFRCDLDHDVAINLARVVRFCVTRGCTHSTRIDQHVVRRMSAWRFPRSHLHSRQARRRRGCAECPERRGCARGGCDTTERRRGHGCGARRRPSRRRLDCGHEEEALERLCCAMCVTVLIFPHGPHTAVSPRLRGALERDDGLNRLLSAINKAPKFTQERTPRQPCPLRQARFFNGPRDAGLTHGPGSITERGFAQVRSDVIAQEQQQVKHDFSGLVQEVRRSVVSCGANAPHPSLLAARQF